jgi:hypothetical protein
MRFKTYVELGRAVKAQNPGLSIDSETVGRKVALEGDYIIDEDPHWGNQVASALAEPFQAIQGMSEGITGTAADVSRQGGQGVAQGVSLGASGYLGRAVDQAMGGAADPQQMADLNSAPYAVGEFVGEIAGPYKAARGLFGRHIVGAANKWGRRVLAGAAEAGAVEGGKALFDEDKNVLSQAATGFTIGAIAETIVAGAVGGGRMGIERLIKPGAGEKINTKIVDWLTERGLPVVPTIARPHSNTMGVVQDKATQSAATMAIVQDVRQQLAGGLQRAKQTFINDVGGNAALKSPLEAGQALYHRVTGVGASLRDKTRSHYKDLAESEIGTVEIDPNLTFTRHLQDGTSVETDLWTSLREALGSHASKKPGSGQPGPLKVLHSIFTEARDAHKVQSREVFGQIEPGPLANLREGADDFQTIFKTESGGGSTFTRSEDFVPYKDYNYWWGITKRIGDLMDTSQYKKNKTVKRHVDSAYHAVQDAMDAQASRLDPNYETAIKSAREMASLSFAYRDLPLVQRITAAPKKYRSEEMVDEIFTNTETMRAAKEMLGPADFSQARQAYLRNLLDRSITFTEAEMKDAASFRKLWQQVVKKGGDTMDSQFMKEMFSEEGFVDHFTGEPIKAMTDGAEKRALMVEFYDMFRVIDGMLGDINPGQEAFGGAGTERGGLASFVNPSDVGGSWRKLKSYAFQLISTARLADEYFKPVDDNIFIAKAIPNWEGNLPAGGMQRMAGGALDALGVSGRKTANNFPSVTHAANVPSQISSGTRQATTSAGLSRIFND